MSRVIQLTVGDSGPDTPISIIDRVTGAAANLTAVATVQLKVRPVGSATTTFTTAPTVSDAAGGIVLIDWGANLAAITPGNYEGEIQFTLTDGKVITVIDYLSIFIRAQFT